MMELTGDSTWAPAEGNLTNSSYPNSTEIDIILSPSIGVASPVIMTLIGVLGNGVALFILYTSRAEVKSTAYFVLLVGQAWSDLFSYLLTAPIPIIVYANNLKWQGGRPVCIFSAFVLIGFGMVIPLFVGCLSLERLLALRFPYFYARVVTVNKARVLFSACWVFVLLFCSLPFIGLGSYEYQFPGTWCFMNFHNESGADSAYAFLYAIFNITVICLIVICNISVVFALAAMKRSKTVPMPTGGASAKDKKSRFQVEMETQMVWFLCAVTLVFVICWIPLNVQIIINLTTSVVDPRADLLSVRLASINQILDPWFYILLRRSVIMKVLKPLKKLMCCWRASHDLTTTPNRMSNSVTNTTPNN